MRKFPYFRSALLSLFFNLLVFTGLLQAQNTTTPVVSQNGVTLQKMVSQSTVPSGVTFTYTIAYSVPAGATSVVITDVIPAPLIVDLITPLGCGTGTFTTVPSATPAGTLLTYTFTAIPAGGCSGTFQVNVHFPGGTTCPQTTVRNRASISAVTLAGNVNLSTEFVSTSALAANPWVLAKQVMPQDSVWYSGGTCPYSSIKNKIRYRLRVSKNTFTTTGVLNLVNGVVTDLVNASAPGATAVLSPIPGNPSAGSATISGGTNLSWTLPASLDATLPYPVCDLYLDVTYPANPGPGTVNVGNTATMTGNLGPTTAPFCGNHNSSASSCVQLLPPGAPTPGLTFWKGVYADNPSPGCKGRYTIFIQNNGFSAINGLTWTDNEPSNIIFTGVQVGNVPPGGGTVTIKDQLSNTLVSTTTATGITAIGAPVNQLKLTLSNLLNTGQYLVVYIDFTIANTASGNIQNCVTGQYNTNTGTPTNLPNVCATFAVVPPQPIACIAKTICNQLPSYTPGQFVRYRLRVQNIGSGNLTAATITDNLSPYLQYVPGSATYYIANTWNPACIAAGSTSIPAGTSVWPGVGTPTVVNNMNGSQTLTWNLPTINSECDTFVLSKYCGQYGNGQIPYYYIEFDVQIKPDAPLGNIPNLFSIAAPGLTAINSNQVVITVNGTYGFTLGKEVRPNGSGPYSANIVSTPGANVDYRLNFVNSGSAPLRNLVLIDLLPRDAGTNDWYILNRANPRGSQFDVRYQAGGNSATPIALPAGMPVTDNTQNICVPEISCNTVGACNPAVWASNAVAQNVKADFGAGILGVANTERFVFGAKVSNTAGAGQKACNTFAAKADGAYLQNNTLTIIPLCGIESPKACITVEQVPVEKCCDSVRIIPTHDLCCSRLQATCPIKSVQVFLSGGTFSNVSFVGSSTGCFGSSTAYIGLANYTWNAVSGPCPGLDMVVCFNANSTGMVNVTYVVTFANGQVCEKTQAYECCCVPKIKWPADDCPNVLLPFSILDPNCKVMSATWDFGDGSGLVSGLTPSHAYALPGTYTVTVTYKNECGEQVVTYTLTIKPCGGQDTCIIKPCFAVNANGLNVSFNATGTTSTHPILLYYWSFGDATTGASVTPTIAHTYTANGVYTVCLTVYADYGGGVCKCQATKCVQIEVKQGAIFNLPCLVTTGTPDPHESGELGGITATPNPFTEVLQVALKNMESIPATADVQVKLLNLQGQVVYHRKLGNNERSFDIEGQQLPAGLYLVSLQVEGELISTLKVIKQ